MGYPDIWPIKKFYTCKVWCFKMWSSERGEQWSIFRKWDDHKVCPITGARGLFTFIHVKIIIIIIITTTKTTTTMIITTIIITLYLSLKFTTWAQTLLLLIIGESKSNQIKCWFLGRGDNESTRRKTSWSRVENQQTQPTYDAGFGNDKSNPGHIGGRRALSPLSHPCHARSFVVDLMITSALQPPLTAALSIHSILGFHVM